MSEALYYITYTGSNVVEVKGAGVFGHGTGAYVSEELARTVQAMGAEWVVRAPSAAPVVSAPAAAPKHEEKRHDAPKHEEKNHETAKHEEKKHEEKKPEAPKADEKKAEEKKEPAPADAAAKS
jgi:outer membrane biosynthesis protein TonB